MFNRFIKKIFSYGASAVLAVCIIVFLISGISTVTLGNTDYKVKYFTDGRVVDMLSIKLEEEYDELMLKTNVPTEVYMNATGAGLIRSVQGTVVKSTQSSVIVDFSGTIDIENRLRASIEKYDKENKINRTEDEMNQLINDAVDVFNKTCSISNTTQLSRIASLVSNRSLQLTVVSVLGIVACIFFEFIFNSGRRKTLNYVAMAMVSAGEILISLCAIVLSRGSLYSLNLTNIEAYNLAIASASKSMMFILLAVSILLVIAGFSVFYSVYRYYKTKLIDFDTENEIMKNLVSNNNENDIEY